MQKIILSLVLSLICISISYAAIDNIIIFGDSLSDAGIPNSFDVNIPKDRGNNYWVRVAGKTGAPITNIDRETNSPLLWINFLIAKQFPGKTIYPVSYLKEKNAYSDNLSYAWASAETGRHYVNDAGLFQFYKPYNDDICSGPGILGQFNSCVPGVLYQVDMYLRDVNNKPNPNSVFIIWAGGNDIFDNMGRLHTLTDPAKFLTEMLKSFSPKELDSAFDLSFPIANLLKAKDELIKAGVKAEQIYVVDLPDIGKSPAGQKLTKQNPTLKHALDVIIKSYNVSLYTTLCYNVLSHHNLSPTHIISTIDLFKAIEKDPASYGLNNLTQSCVDENNAPYCDGYLFFNDKHASTVWGNILGNAIYEQINR